MNILKKVFKALLIYGFFTNFMFGFTTIAAENEKEIADYFVSKSTGKPCKLSFNPIGTWEQIIKNLIEIKNQLIRLWRAE